MSTLIIHLGLPKTATTTLQQDIFPKLARNGVDYLGVLQPRSKQQTETYKYYYNAVMKGHDLSKTKDLLSNLMRCDNNILISEEMTLVSNIGNSWRNKINTLSLLVKGLDYQLIITVREPLRAMFSYYVEILPTILKSSGQLVDPRGFVWRALHDEIMEIFHYEKLIDHLTKNFDKSRINVVRFEDIIKGEISSILNIIGSDENYVYSMGRKNIKKRDDNYVYANGYVTLGDWFIARSSKKYRSFFKAFHKIKLTDIRITHPSDEQYAQINSVISKETKALNEFVGTKLY